MTDWLQDHVLYICLRQISITAFEKYTLTLIIQSGLVTARAILSCIKEMLIVKYRVAINYSFQIKIFTIVSVQWCTCIMKLEDLKTVCISLLARLDSPINDDYPENVLQEVSPSLCQTSKVWSSTGWRLSWSGGQNWTAFFQDVSFVIL